MLCLRGFELYYRWVPLDIGFIFDNTLTMSLHINDIVKGTFKATLEI